MSSSIQLNAFVPYETPPTYENSLTRAFLILLKSVTSIQVAFRDLVMSQVPCGEEIGRRRHVAGGLQAVGMQTRSLNEMPAGIEAGRVVSVLISNDRFEKQVEVTRTQRDAIYDAVLYYEPAWIFVIENKPDVANVWTEQLSSRFAETVEVIATPVKLSWRDIIAAVSAIRSEGLAFDASAVLIDDFLDYVDRFFGHLNPYSNFVLCKGNEDLLQRRCCVLMGETALGTVSRHRGWGSAIEIATKPGVSRLKVWPENVQDGVWELALRLYPGDTLSQARLLYPTITVAALDELVRDGWSIEPNFHFSFRSSGLDWPQVRMSTRDYVEYWKSEVSGSRLKQLARDNWRTAFDTWVSIGMFAAGDLETLLRKYTDTQMRTLNVCPGLRYAYRWTPNRALELDAAGALSRQVADQVQRALATW